MAPVWANESAETYVGGQAREGGGTHMAKRVMAHIWRSNVWHTYA